MTFLDHLPDSRSYLPVARMLGDNNGDIPISRRAYGVLCQAPFAFELAPTQNLVWNDIIVLGAAHRGLTIILNIRSCTNSTSGRHYATLTHRCQRLANEKARLTRPFAQRK